jgi:hypothetical protein
MMEVYYMVNKLAITHLSVISLCMVLKTHINSLVIIYTMSMLDSTLYHSKIKEKDNSLLKMDK